MHQPQNLVSHLILALFFLLIATSNSTAQEESKVNIELYKTLQVAQTNQKKIILVKGDLTAIKNYSEAHSEIQYRYGVKDIASIETTILGIRQLNQQKFIQRIEYNPAHGHLFNQESRLINPPPGDSAVLYHNNTLKAHDGVAPLPNAFTGKGVIVGIIDDGFDPMHPDFQNQDGSSRVLYLWDQVYIDPRYPVPFYGYGSVWPRAAIEQHQCIHPSQYHGSHVAGSAGGNGRAANKYKGVAPQSDLIFVRVNMSTGFNTGFVDAVKFIFDKADQLGKPCSINSSVGSYSGGHDALDLYTQLVENMILAKQGRVLVQAAGNARQKNFHVKTTLNNSSKISLIHQNPKDSFYHFFLYADTLDLQNITLKLSLEDTTRPSNNILVLRLPGTSLTSVSGLIYEKKQLFTYNKSPVIVEYYVDPYEDSYQLYFKVTVPNTLGLLKLESTGTGTHHIWSSLNETGTSRLVQNYSAPNFVKPDNHYTLAGAWNCSPHLISVAAYQNRSNYVNYWDDTISFNRLAPPGGMSHFSSIGPTRKEVLKPNISGPGGDVMSCIPLSTIDAFKTKSSPQWSWLDKSAYHGRQNGTSMSAPMVAGACALYLQCNPQASAAEIKTQLEQSARQDNYVFKESPLLPNVHWGYGKLDVFELLKSCLVKGCMDPLAINYTPNAHLQDTCFYLLTNKKKLQAEQFLHCTPNPFQNNCIIQFEGLAVDYPVQVKLFNHLGQLIDQQVLNNFNTQIAINAPVAGIYYISARTKTQQQYVRKIIKAH